MQIVLFLLLDALEAAVQRKVLGELVSSEDAVLDAPNERHLTRRACTYEDQAKVAARAPTICAPTASGAPFSAHNDS